MLLGIRKPVYLIVPGNEVTDIVNISAMAVFEAQMSSKGNGAASMKALEKIHSKSASTTV